MYRSVAAERGTTEGRGTPGGCLLQRPACSSGRYQGRLKTSYRSMSCGNTNTNRKDAR
jgi:hypothetical protein